MELRESPFGKNLLKELEIQGLKINDLAQLSGISRKSIYKIINCNDCSFSTMLKLCEVIKVPIHEMLNSQRYDEIKNEIHLTNRWRNIHLDYNMLTLNKQDKMIGIIENIILAEVNEIRRDTSVSSFVKQM